MNPDTPQAGKRGRSASRAGGSAESAGNANESAGQGQSPSEFGSASASSGVENRGTSGTEGASGIGGGTYAGNTGGQNTQPSGGDDMRSQASGLFDQVRSKASSQLNAQKERATAGLGSVASAVRQTSQQFRDQQYGPVADLIDNAASRLEQFSSHLRDRDVSQLIDEAQSLARQQPALFVGTSFAAGLLAARFIRASAPQGRRAERARSNGESIYGTAEGRGEAGREIF